MQLSANDPTQRLLLEYLDANASDALREKIAALPDGERFNLGRAWSYIEERARKYLHGKSGCVDDQTVFGWLIHYYEDVAPTEAAQKASAAAKKPAPAEKPAPETAAESGFSFSLFEGGAA